MSVLDARDVGADVEEHRGGHDHHGRVYEKRAVHGEGDVDQLMAEVLALALAVEDVRPVLDEPGVEVDDVRHHGRADHGDGNVDRAQLDPWNEHAVQDPRGIGVRNEDLDDEGRADDRDERHDRELEAHVAKALHGQATRTK